MYATLFWISLKLGQKPQKLALAKGVNWQSQLQIQRGKYWLTLIRTKLVGWANWPPLPTLACAVLLWPLEKQWKLHVIS